MPRPRPRKPITKEERKDAKKVMKRLFGYIFKHYAFQITLVFVCIIVSVLANIQGTLFMQTLIDSYITPMLKTGSTDFGPLAKAMLRIIIYYAIGVAATYVYNLIMVYIAQGTLKSFREQLFNKMESLPIKYFDTHKHGDIMSIYTNDIDTLHQMISQSLPQMLNAALTIVMTMVSMFMLNVPLTILTLAMTGLTVFATGKLASKSGKNFVRQQNSLAKVNAKIEETMKGQKVVKVFNHEDEMTSEFKEMNDELFDAANKANAYGNVLGPVNAQLGNISYVLVAVVGGLVAIFGNGSLTVGKLASFLTFNKSFNMPIMQVSQQLNFIVMAMAGGKRIFELLDEEPEEDNGYVTLVNANVAEDGTITEAKERTGKWAWKHYHKAENTTDYKLLQGEVVFKDVNFSYVPEKEVLHHIDLYAKPGQKIAFVGATGAGKTTITNLINRFYDVSDGRIRYDGINVNKIKKADLRHSLGIVLQDTHLFTGTVEENIRYGKEEATHEEVVAAAKLANADGFIRRLENGYDTVLKRDGGTLSQGQRQHLAIARAAIADPPVLILDEATSSIDTHTERLVQSGMDRLMSGRTTFVIAHRLSTIRNSDCIMVLDDGQIIERGNHEELMAEQGKYYQLYTGKLVNA
jgi:ATP-binding cassette subfamily B protein